MSIFVSNPLKQMLCSNGNNATVAAATTSFIGFWRDGIIVTGAQGFFMFPQDWQPLQFLINTNTAQPGTGSLELQFFDGTTTQTIGTITAGEAAGVKFFGLSLPIQSSITSCRFNLKNNAPAAVSAQIREFSCLMNIFPVV